MERLSLADMGVSLVSILMPRDDVPVDVIHAIRMGSIEKLVQVAREDLGSGMRLTVRDLLPVDIGYTNQEYTDTSGATDNAYAATSISADTIANNTFVVVWGVRLHFPIVGVTSPPVTVLRWTVGGARVAQWSLYNIAHTQHPDNVEAFGIRPITGISLSPIIIRQNMPLTVDAYVVTVSTGFVVTYDGAVCEPEGSILKP